MESEEQYDDEISKEDSDDIEDFNDKLNQEEQVLQG